MLDDDGAASTTPSMSPPPDAPQLAPAMARLIARTGHRPRAVTAYRGYGWDRTRLDGLDGRARAAWFARTPGRSSCSDFSAEGNPARCHPGDRAFSRRLPGGMLTST